VRIHIVQPDETWADIAERYGITSEEIRMYTGVAEADLHPGMKLKIPPLRSVAEDKDPTFAEGSAVRDPAEEGAATRAEAAAGSETAVQALTGPAYVSMGGGTYGGMRVGLPESPPLAGGWNAPGLWCVPAYFPGFFPTGWSPVFGGGMGVWPPTTWPTPVGYGPGSPAVGTAGPSFIGNPSWRPPEIGAHAFWEGIARTSAGFAGPSFDGAVEQSGEVKVEEGDEAFPKMLWGGDVEEA